MIYKTVGAFIQAFFIALSVSTIGTVFVIGFIELVSSSPRPILLTVLIASSIILPSAYLSFKEKS